MNFLQGGAAPGQWEKQGLQWTPPYSTGPLNRNGLLARKAVQGLGISGIGEAAAFLKGLQRQTKTLPATANAPPADLIEEAIQTNQSIVQKGFAVFTRQK